MLTNIDFLFIILYIVIVIGLGYWSSKKQTSSDFMIAERKLGLLSFTGSVVVSIIGAGALILYAAYIFEFGITTFFAFIGVFLGFITFSLSARKLRRFAHENNFHTMADFFHFHFNKKIGHLIAFVMLTIWILITLNQFIAGTQILSAISGWSYFYSLLITGLVIAIYLGLGGFRSVIKTDVFQYVVMILLIFVVGISMASGVNLPKESFLQLTFDPGLIISFLFIGLLGIWFSADLWQRVYAAKNEMVVKKGLILSGISMFVIGIGLSFIGLSTKTSFPGIDPAQAFIYGLVNLLPNGVLGIGVVFVFAAIMSSADTSVFLLSTNISKDFITHFKKKKLTSDELRKYTKIGIFAIILVDILLAYFFRSIVDIGLISIGLGLSLTPVIIGSFKWKLKSNAVKMSVITGVLHILVFVSLGMIRPEPMASSVVTATLFLLLFQWISKK